MNSASIDVFALAEKRLEWTGQRQAVLAQNIANANTPGYVAREVKPFNEVLAAQAQQTAVGRFGTAAASPKSVADLSVTERSMNGNAVVLDEQLEKVAETDNSSQLAINLYKKYQSMFRIALGRN